MDYRILRKSELPKITDAAQLFLKSKVDTVGIDAANKRIDWREQYVKLSRLTDDSTIEDVRAIIGPCNLVTELEKQTKAAKRKYKCWTCDAKTDMIIEIGQPAEIESSTWRLCQDCFNSMADSVRAELDGSDNE